MPLSDIQSIAIMFHERDRSAQRENYRIWPIAENWRRAGIVKTNRNSGGFKDLNFGQSHAQSFDEHIRKRLAWQPWLSACSLSWTHTLKRYPIFEHASQVPGGTWRNSQLVVEKFFTPDRDANGDHVLYLWIVMGTAAIGRTLHSADPFVKSASARLGSF